jgi:hypothetical protein
MCGAGRQWPEEARGASEQRGAARPRARACPCARPRVHLARLSRSILRAAHLPLAPASRPLLALDSARASRPRFLRGTRSGSPAQPPRPPRPAAGPGRSAAEGEGRPEPGRGGRGDDEQVPKVALQTQGERPRPRVGRLRVALFSPQDPRPARASLPDETDPLSLSLHDVPLPRTCEPLPSTPPLGQTLVTLAKPQREADPLALALGLGALSLSLCLRTERASLASQPRIGRAPARTRPAVPGQTPCYFSWSPPRAREAALIPLPAPFILGPE